MTLVTEQLQIRQITYTLFQYTRSPVTTNAGYVEVILLSPLTLVYPEWSVCRERTLPSLQLYASGSFIAHIVSALEDFS